VAAPDKTEAPTQRRRQRARERGTVARTPVAPAVGAVGGAVLMLDMAGAWAWGWMGHLMRAPMAQAPDAPTLAWGMALARQAVVAAAVPVLVITGGAVAGAVMAGIAQTGVSLTPFVLQPSLGRLNPLAGLGRMFSGRVLMDVVRIGAIVVVIGIMLRAALVSGIADLAAGAAVTPAGVASVLRAVASSLVGRLLALGIAAAAADYVWQRLRTERELRMTRQELRDEIRETEGDPYWRARRRARMRAIARARMMRSVPTATVVVTNPTEVAVALRYEPGLTAPQVVAKGRGQTADRIRAIAWRAGVPIHPNPPLARALYAAAEVGQYIPPRLYRAVAEVLAWVYRSVARPEAAHG
jgi:flagellar biosynthetic protein FlhB